MVRERQVCKRVDVLNPEICFHRFALWLFVKYRNKILPLNSFFLLTPAPKYGTWIRQLDKSYKFENSQQNCYKYPLCPDEAYASFIDVVKGVVQSSSNL